MSGEITTIIVSAIAASVSAPLGAWVNSKILKQKYEIEISKLRAEIEALLSTVKKSELDNVREAIEILMENIVKPLKIEIQDLREDVDKFRQAVEKIPSCPMADSCPVSRELLNAKAGDTHRTGKGGK